MPGIACPKKIFYGWWIALATAAANALSGGIYFYGFSTFFIPLEKEFGWSRAALSGAFSLSRLEGGVFGPLGGYLVDRFGPRPIMIAGVSVMGVGYLLLSRIDSIAAFYIVFVLMIAGGASLGIQVPPLVTTAKWFIKRRGTAMGIALSGVGIGGLVLPALGWLVQNYGWRFSANVSGVVILAVGLPLAMVMRSRPEKYGLLPDGAGPLPAAHETDALAQETGHSTSGSEALSAEGNFTIRQALATPVFWFLALAFGLRQLVVSAVALHQIPFLVDIGVSQQMAATMLGALALLSIIGRMGFGWMADRFEKRKLMAFSLAQLAVGCLIFAGVTSLWQVVLFLLIYPPHTEAARA